LQVPVTSKQLENALTISGQWRDELNLHELIEARLREADVLGETVDIVAIGKASRTMTGACRAIFGDRVRRAFMVVDEAETTDEGDSEVVVGEHPLPGEGSLRAGERLLAFLEESSEATCTVFLVSGGASSLCARPQAPIDTDDLHEIFKAALQSGVDITTLNKVRAATSSIAGGSILRQVHTERSVALIMVDNVISGAPWVASALTYDYEPTEDDVTALLERVNCADTPLATRVFQSSERRRRLLQDPVTTMHENYVVAQPSMVLDAAARNAAQLGYRVILIGSDVHGDVRDVVANLTTTLAVELLTSGPLCVLGVGEVTVQVRGAGTGGRCQEFAWAMAEVLAALERPGVFVACATDGRDFVRGVAGGWVDGATLQKAQSLGIDWTAVADDNDTFSGLLALEQLLDGTGTGWNLCDLYVTVFE
jgi:glycerate 2-kinase